MVTELDLLGKQAEKYSAEIKEWNIHCVLPEGFVLADGKSVSKLKKGYVDHGADFGDMGTVGFRMGSQAVREEHPEANLIELHQFRNGQLLKYWFRMSFRDEFNRSGIGRMHADFYFDDNLGESLLKDSRQNLDLLDKLLTTKFPSFKNDDVKPWKELIFLPLDLNYPNRNDKLQVLAKR